MHPAVLRLGAAFALGSALVGLPALADDSKSTSGSQKRPDFTGYVYVSDVVGEVVKANDKSVTVRVTWYSVQSKGGGRGRPGLYGNGRNYRNPFAPNMNRPRQPQIKEQHHDYTLGFLPQSLVRTRTLPAKTDENGKKVSYTQKEIDELRKPDGVTGYAASAFDLTPGTIVELILIRDKSVSAEKAAESDLRVKYAIIWGKDPSPPKDIADQGNGKGNAKKKN